MALNITRDIAEARKKANARLGIAADTDSGGAPEDYADRVRVQKDIRAALVEAVYLLESDVADSREKSLALTKFEEGLMWAGKAIFS